MLRLSCSLPILLRWTAITSQATVAQESERLDLLLVSTQILYNIVIKVPVLNRSIRNYYLMAQAGFEQKIRLVLLTYYALINFSKIKFVVHIYFRCSDYQVKFLFFDTVQYQQGPQVGKNQTIIRRKFSSFLFQSRKFLISAIVPDETEMILTIELTTIARPHSQLQLPINFCLRHRHAFIIANQLPFLTATTGSTDRLAQLPIDFCLHPQYASIVAFATALQLFSSAATTDRLSVCNRLPFVTAVHCDFCFCPRLAQMFVVASAFRILL